MNNTRIAVLRPQVNFTMVPNEAIRCKELSFRAVGLYVYLISLPPGAGTTLARLNGLKAEGKDAIAAARGELERAGFLRVIEDRHAGRFAGKIWCLALKPHQFEELLPGADGDVPPAPEPEKPVKAKPVAVSPPAEIPAPANPPQYKTSDQKTDPCNMEPPPAERVGMGPHPLETLVADWNRMARENPGIPPVARLNRGERRDMAEARLKDAHWRATYRAALAQIPNREWRMGKTLGKNRKDPWYADFTYFVRPDTVDKLIEEAEGDKAQLARRSRNLPGEARAEDRPGAFVQ